MLRVKNLSVAYGKANVIKSVSFELRPSLVALIGPNGSGKTTLLKAIAGIIPYSGEVLIDCINLRRIRADERTKYVTYVPPTISALPDMTIGDLLLSDSNADVALLEKYVRIFGVEHLLFRRIWEVSSGELERALLARGLARRSKVLLVDEPLSYTDVRYQLVVMRCLRKLANEGRVVVVASNQLNPLLNYVDHVLALKDGKLFINASLKTGVDEDKLSELYGVKMKVITIGNIVDVVPVDEAKG